MATKQEIWETLSNIDVSDHIDQKGNLSYLSWPWAWAVMKNNYPQFAVEWISWSKSDGTMTDVLTYDNGSCSVSCIIDIDGCNEYMWLPVMDYKNKAIVNPDSRAISDSKMRCLVKCFALHGLGHYIYAGEDLPSSPSTEEAKETQPKKETKPKKETNNKSKISHPEISPPEDEETGTVMAYSVFAEGCKTLPELHEFWKSNQDDLIKMEENEPVLYEKVLDAFSKKKQQLAKEAKDA